MSDYFEMAANAARAAAAPHYAQAVTSQAKRILELETALNRMVCAHDNTLADSEGKWPQPDMGCVICTAGTVPNALNTGLCAKHNAMKLLGQL